MSYLLNSVLIALPISILVIGTIFFFEQRRLGRHRGVSREAFISAFADTEIPAEIPTVVYDYYRSRAFSSQFSVAPDDDYGQVLSEGEEDIEDDALFLMKRLGLKLPPELGNLEPDTKIRTIRDMVHWLERIRQHRAKLS